jgi:hypothetical protein
MIENLLRVRNWGMLAPGAFYVIGLCFSLTGALRAIWERGSYSFLGFGLIFLIVGYAEQRRGRLQAATLNGFHLIALLVLFVEVAIMCFA